MSNGMVNQAPLFNGIQAELIKRIALSTSSLKIAVTWFTNHDIFNAIVKKLEKPDYKLIILVLNDRINNKKEGVDFQRLIDNRGEFYYSAVDSMVHHKFCIIDDEAVVTGSYNWTYYAENRNWENVVVIENKEAVAAYVEEFDRITQSHIKVDNISEKQRLDVSFNSNEYLITDYVFQAKNAELRGDDLGMAKLYTEILRIDTKQHEVIKDRNAIIHKINSQRFETCPFEIGIRFKNGYAMTIPAFAPLPITVKKRGVTPINNAEALQVTIQKYDYAYQTLTQFSMNNLKPCVADTPKIEHTMTVDHNGILTIFCQELNGYGRTKTEKVNLRDFL